MGYIPRNTRSKEGSRRHAVGKVILSVWMNVELDWISTEKQKELHISLRLSGP